MQSVYDKSQLVGNADVIPLKVLEKLFNDRFRKDTKRLCRLMWWVRTVTRLGFEPRTPSLKGMCSTG